MPQSDPVRNIIRILPQFTDLQRNDGCEPEVAIASHSQHNHFPPFVVHSRFESQAFIRIILQVSVCFSRSGVCLMYVGVIQFVSHVLPFLPHQAYKTNL